MTINEIKTRLAAITGYQELISETPVENVGKYQKGYFIVKLSTGTESTNLVQRWFIKNTETSDYTFQNEDVVAGPDTTSISALQTYLKNNFYAFRIEYLDVANLFAICTVYVDGTTVTEKRVLVKKVGASVVTKDIA